MDTSARPWRISGIAGLLFVITSLVASATSIQPPQFNQDAAAIAAWYAENSRPYRVGHFVAGVAFLFFYVPFFAGLCERLREAPSSAPRCSRMPWPRRRR